MQQLAEYNRKRDFSITAEPAGAVRPKRKRGDSFVIQKHAASHLHYDFRLEADGVLKSWAVPKGPSLDPAIKRLAVEVEDHPLSYASFEGNIPEDQYGGGDVIVWDRGRWKPDGDVHKQLRSGRLRFTLDGEKLHGVWNLVRTQKRGGKQHWLLFKARDDEARPEAEYDVTVARPESVISGHRLPGEEAKPDKRTRRAEKSRHVSRVVKRSAQKLPPGREPLPDFVQPQLATLVNEPPQGEHFLSEIKFDGYRALSRIERISSKKPRAVTLHTRNGNDWTKKFTRIAKALAELPVDSAYLDGEVVVLGEEGASDFQALQNSFAAGAEAPLYYFVFDLLHLNGYDLRNEPLIRRKELLKALLDQHPHERIRYSDHVVGDAATFLRDACSHGLEGIVCKNGQRPYVSGRTTDWQKVKCTNRQEFVIVGYSAPKGSRQHLGALLLGTYEADGALRYVGRVGTGFSHESLRELESQLVKLHTGTPPVVNPPRARDITWVSPKLVGEIQFGHLTHDKLLRQAVFFGLREDKRPKQVHIEESAITLTHPDKVLFPPDGPTKQELVDYFEKVARRLLPYVADRPLALLRCPEGHQKGCFFQKHVDKARVEPGLTAVTLKEDDGESIYRTLSTEIGLRSLVQLGTLELHTLGVHAATLEHPDELVFDLDPAPDVAWKQVIDAARNVRALLSRLKLKSFAKLTGGKGIHLHVPIAPRYSWTQVKNFCETVAHRLEQDFPELFTASASKAKRGGKIYLDFRRNQRGAHYIAPFSPRARTGAAIAAPITWTALTARLHPNAYTVRTIDKYLATYKRDPWTNYFKLAQRIKILDSKDEA
jgi:bifunctional non-homologous end joining protein LigD